jgi:hypothetical protein
VARSDGRWFLEKPAEMGTEENVQPVSVDGREGNEVGFVVEEVSVST